MIIIVVIDIKVMILKILRPTYLNALIINFAHSKFIKI